MKKLLFMISAAALLTAFVLPSLMAAEAPPDGRELSYLSKVVVFNHSAHASQECVRCHHKWDGTSEIAGCTMAGCHDVFDKTVNEPASLYFIIHKGSGDMGGCVNCHKAQAGDDRDLKKKLTGCAQSACHP